MTQAEFEIDLPMLRHEVRDTAYRWLFKRVDRQYVDDIVQDVLLAFGENLEARERWGAKFYIRRITRNRCVEGYRKRLKSPGPLYESIEGNPIHPELIVGSAENAYLEQSTMSNIAEAFYSLSKKSQRILLAEFVERVGQEEHAERIGVTSRTLRNWKTRALKEITLAHRLFSG
jgi:RNA polymerase sigma factor (sigma-70 family)